MTAGTTFALSIGQRVKHHDYKGRRVTGVVRLLSIDPERGLMVDIALDKPIVIPPLTSDDREIRVYSQYAQAHEFTPFDERDELLAEMLEALRASVAFVEGAPGAVEPFALIRAVIAKAEGGAP